MSHEGFKRLKGVVDLRRVLDHPDRVDGERGVFSHACVGHGPEGERIVDFIEQAMVVQSRAPRFAKRVRLFRLVAAIAQPADRPVRDVEMTWRSRCSSACCSESARP